MTADDKPEAFGSNMSYWATASLLGLGTPPDERGADRDRPRARRCGGEGVESSTSAASSVAKQHLDEGRRHRLHRAVRRVHRRAPASLRVVALRLDTKARRTSAGRLGRIGRAPGTNRRRQRVRRRALRTRQEAGCTASPAPVPLRPATDASITRVRDEEPVATKNGNAARADHARAHARPASANPAAPAAPARGSRHAGGGCGPRFGRSIHRSSKRSSPTRGSPPSTGANVPSSAAAPMRCGRRSG